MVCEQILAEADLKQIRVVSNSICFGFVKSVEISELCWFSKASQIFLYTVVYVDYDCLES